MASEDIFLVEAIAYVPNLAATDTLRFATRTGFITKPSETPASKVFGARVKQPLVMKRTLFGAGTTRGRSTTGFGNVVLNNGDGILDPLLTYGLDGRAITIRRGPEDGDYPTDFTTELVATMGPPEVNQDTVQLKLRDRQQEVDTVFQTTKFAGSGLGTVEGVAGDIKGKPKPFTYGKVYNVAPPCVETAKLIFQVHDTSGATVAAAYDQGLALTPAGATYASLAALLASGPSSGEFKIYSGSEGTFFRLGATPAGLVTADVTEGATSADRTVAQLFKRLLVRKGLTGSDYSASDITTLDAALTGETGVYVDSETTYAAVFDKLSETAGGSWFVDRTNVFRFAQLLAPSGTPAATFTANSLKKPLRRITTNDKGQGLPSYLTIVRYARNYVTQDQDLAGGVTAARREAIANEWREAKATDATVQTTHLQAVQTEENTCFAAETDAQSEATRRQDLRGVQRDLFLVTVELNDDTDAVDLNQVIELSHPRFGLSVVGSDDGGLFRVTEISANGEDKEIEFTVWGSPLGIANRILTADLGSPYRVTTDGEYRVTAA